MIESWRWFGKKDPVSLSYVRQAGAVGVVSALHHIPNGRVWDIPSITAHQKYIADNHLTWNVVESVPVHEAIKTQQTGYKTYISAYKDSLVNIAKCGIKTVCYNFMPVVDWTRTDLQAPMADGALALRFDADKFGVFDIHLLNRKNARNDYTDTELSRIDTVYKTLSESDKDTLIKNVIAGLPGSENSYGIMGIKQQISAYTDMTADDLRRNLRTFLHHIVPVAQQVGINLCIHPDDPPRPVLGLPRVVSTASDVEYIYDSVDSICNGLTFCTGSFGVRPDNDVVQMAQKFGERIHFAHLRTTKREQNPLSFHEAPHLAGDVPMVAVIDVLLSEQAKRKKLGRTDIHIPFRPDHGHQMLDDIGKIHNPGYSAIGRLRGLAELRGIIHALTQTKQYG